MANQRVKIDLTVKEAERLLELCHFGLQSSIGDWNWSTGQPRYVRDKIILLSVEDAILTVAGKVAGKVGV